MATEATVISRRVEYGSGCRNRSQTLSGPTTAVNSAANRSKGARVFPRREGETVRPNNRIAPVAINSAVASVRPARETDATTQEKSAAVMTR